MTATATAAAGARALDVAAPVLARRGAGTVRTVTRHAVHVDLGGWVLTVTGPATPALPNALRLRVEPGPLAGPPGAPAVLAPGLLRAGGLVARWEPDAPPAWEPRLPALAPGPALAARGHAVLAALGGRAPVLAARLPGALCEPARLVGLGAGLTPEGDDLLAGAAAALAARGRRLPLPGDVRARTTALSATLLELAARGAAPAPAHALVDPARDGWRAALEELCRLGSSTGRAWAAGLAWGLAAG